MKREIKNSVPVKVLILLSIVFTSVGCVPYFFNYNIKINSFLDKIYYGNLEFFTPSASIVGMFILDILPCILFAIYIFIFCKRFKASVLLPVVFICFSINYMQTALTYHNLDNKIFIIIVNAILFLLFIAGCINSCINFRYKILTPIVLGAGIAELIIPIVDYFKYFNYYIEKDLKLYIITYLCKIAGPLLLFIALLLFLMKNDIKIRTEITGIKKLPAEKSLPLLKEQFEYGMYSEEDYNKKRAEIISKV